VHEVDVHHGGHHGHANEQCAKFVGICCLVFCLIIFFSNLWWNWFWGFWNYKNFKFEWSKIKV